MKQVFIICLFSMGFNFTAQAAVKNAEIQKNPSISAKLEKANSKKSDKSKKNRNLASKASKKEEKWNEACDGLLDNSVANTIALEKSLSKKKSKLSRAEFDEKVQNELLVVQLNAWVCAISSGQQKAASAEQEFLQDYSKRVQNRKL